MKYLKLSLDLKSTTTSKVNLSIAKEGGCVINLAICFFFSDNLIRTKYIYDNVYKLYIYRCNSSYNNICTILDFFCERNTSKFLVTVVLTHFDFIVGSNFFFRFWMQEIIKLPFCYSNSKHHNSGTIRFKEI